MGITAVILAAGKGKRMNSNIPKVLHKIGSKTLLEIILDKLKRLTNEIIVVLGYKAEKVTESLRESLKDVKIVIQENQLGTAHAVKLTIPEISHDRVLITVGDAPLIKIETLKKALEELKRCDMVVVAMRVKNPTGYGRIITEGNKVLAIKEEVDLAENEKMIDLVNTGIYALKKSILLEYIDKIRINEKKGEYHLTDIVELANNDKKNVNYIEVKEEEGMGINDRKQLSTAFKNLFISTATKLQEDGVTILSPENTFIEEGVKIGKDTVIWPFVFIEGDTEIGENCEIMPFTVIRNSKIAKGTKIREYSHIEGAVIEERAVIGPFARIRPESVIGKEVKIGNFVELKKTVIGERSQANHLAYLGDAFIGKNVNIGAGVITCNYDGVRKNPTYIGDESFIGSDCQLVAPVKIGSGTLVGAGTTVTKDTPDDSLVVSRAPLKIIKGKGIRYYREKKKGEQK